MSEVASRPWHSTLPIQVPWTARHLSDLQVGIYCPGNVHPWRMATVEAGDIEQVKAYAALIIAVPDMLEALHNVRKLISEAAMTGFNCKDGDWADRLFFSQQMTSAAIDKATRA
jgi:hypothetical protein